MSTKFYKTELIALILVYLVIVAGALVRMTGSGMGCPDWPKCFGYYIPPTDIKELTWTPNRAFEEGQVIIKDEKLWVANADFVTKNKFDPLQWRPYTKHDYAIFNATETWIEYINRLAGALAGVVVFIGAVLSFGYWKKDKKITILAWLVVFLMGLQGWLGARVVYSVLNPIKITIHTVVAFIIVGFLVQILYLSKNNVSVLVNKKIKIIIGITMLLSLIQIGLGTQVRQFVDDQIKILGTNQLNLVFQNPTTIFYIHRSFSILIFGLNLYLFMMNRKLNLKLTTVNWIFACILLEILTGIIIYYFDFPFASQPIHLILASILFGLQYYLWIRIIEN